MGRTLNSGINRSGVTVVGNKVVAAINPYRTGMTVQNTSDTNMYVNETGDVASATNSYLVGPGISVNVSTGLEVSVYCTVAGKTYAATEF